MSDGQFERSRIELGNGRGITITSWFDADKNQWRASAPAFLHLLAGADGQKSQDFSGATRDKAILSVRSVLVNRLAPRDN